MKDAKGHGSDPRGGGGDGGFKAILGAMRGGARVGPGEAKTAAIAAQHGIDSPAVQSTGPRWDAEASRTVVGAGRGQPYATSGGMRAAREIRTRLQLGGKL